jgi:hypothetical protein
VRSQFRSFDDCANSWKKYEEISVCGMTRVRFRSAKLLDRMANSLPRASGVIALNRNYSNRPEVQAAKMREYWKSSTVLTCSWRDFVRRRSI